MLQQSGKESRLKGNLIKEKRPHVNRGDTF